jgi:hypothetical protein
VRPTLTLLRLGVTFSKKSNLPKGKGETGHPRKAAVETTLRGPKNPAENSSPCGDSEGTIAFRTIAVREDLWRRDFGLSGHPLSQPDWQEFGAPAGGLVCITCLLKVGRKPAVLFGENSVFAKVENHLGFRE